MNHVFWLACSRYSVSRVRRSDGGEQVKLHTGKTRGKKTGGEWSEIEGMPVNILNKGLFRFTGFQYTLLLVDYDTC